MDKQCEQPEQPRQRQRDPQPQPTIAILHFDPMDTTYFASRETIIASAHRGMPVWRDKLFALMHRNAASATSFFRIPGNRLVELGAQVQI